MCLGSNQTQPQAQFSAPYPTAVHLLFIFLDLGWPMSYPASALAGSIHKVFNQDWLIYCTQVIGAAWGLICLTLWTLHLFLANAHCFILDFGSTTYTLVQLY